MKLLFLSKKNPMERDLFHRPYGRFYHIPKYLAQQGHEVHLSLLDYKFGDDFHAEKNKIYWHSISAKNPLKYYIFNKNLTKSHQIDWVIGFSDTYYGIIAHNIAANNHTNSLIDAYDNYESYIPWCIPLHHLWRKSIASANVVTAAGPGLANLLSENRNDKPTEIVAMTADPEFVKLDKQYCRESLGLPQNKTLIGYCGSVAPSRDFDNLLKAFELLTQNSDYKHIELVLAGRKRKSVNLPSHTRWLGYLPDVQVPNFINSLDLLVVINKQSTFGNHSYPVKLYEAMNCQIPAIATKTLATEWILADHPELLFEPSNPIQLCDKIKFAIVHKKTDYGKLQNWDEIGYNFNQIIINYR